MQKNLFKILLSLTFATKLLAQDPVLPPVDLQTVQVRLNLGREHVELRLPLTFLGIDVEDIAKKRAQEIIDSNHESLEIALNKLEAMVERAREELVNELWEDESFTCYDHTHLGFSCQADESLSYMVPRIQNWLQQFDYEQACHLLCQEKDSSESDYSFEIIIEGVYPFILKGYLFEDDSWVILVMAKGENTRAGEFVRLLNI